MCEECGLIYKEEVMAEKCQKYCRDNNACNLEYVKFAINPLKLSKG